MKLTAQLHGVPRSRMGGAINLLSNYAVKAGKVTTFYLYLYLYFTLIVQEQEFDIFCAVALAAIL
jgi:hypothetical protein